MADGTILYLKRGSIAGCKSPFQIAQPYGSLCEAPADSVKRLALNSIMSHSDLVADNTSVETSDEWARVGGRWVSRPHGNRLMVKEAFPWRDGVAADDGRGVRRPYWRPRDQRVAQQSRVGMAHRIKEPQSTAGERFLFDAAKSSANAESSLIYSN